MKLLQKTKLNCLMVIGLTILLAIQMSMSLHFGAQKKGFHEDEIATYELSNTSDGLWRTWITSQWHTGKEYQESFVLSSKSTFSYEMVYENQEKDVHPPLYYFLIHTISSVVPGIFSKWIGIAPNIAFALMTTIIIWAISIMLTKNNWLALITASFFALSVGTFSMVVFIRMYAMLAFVCSLLVLYHIRLACNLVAQREIGLQNCLILLICTSLGILTQYYFMIFCFFLCGCFSIALFLLKKRKSFFAYIGTELGAIVLSIGIFPSIIKHCFGGYRGAEALTNAISSDPITNNLKAVSSIINNQIANGWLFELGKILAMLVLLIFINRCLLHLKFNFDKSNYSLLCKVDIFTRPNLSWAIPFEGFVYFTLVCIILGYIFVVAKIAPYQVDRYYMCIYPLIYIVTAHLIYFVFEQIFSRSISVAITFALVFFVCISGHFNQDVNYLYKDYSQREILNKYTNLPVIVLNGTYDWYPDRWIYEYMQNPIIFRTQQYCDLSTMSENITNQDLSKGFLVYSCRMNMSEEEMFSQLGKKIAIKSYKRIVSVDDPVYLCYAQ